MRNLFNNPRVIIFRWHYLLRYFWAIELPPKAFDSFLNVLPFRSVPRRH